MADQHILGSHCIWCSQPLSVPSDGKHPRACGANCAKKAGLIVASLKMATHQDRANVQCPQCGRVVGGNLPQHMRSERCKNSVAARNRQAQKAKKVAPMTRPAKPVNDDDFDVIED